jgi:hypothetical protein
MGVESFNSSISTPSLALPLQGGGKKEPDERSGFGRKSSYRGKKKVVSLRISFPDKRWVGKGFNNERREHELQNRI